MKLQRHGAKFVLAYFDENTIDDSRGYKGHEFARENYQFLLEKVVSDHTLGVVIKPKNPISLRSRLGELGQLLTRAEETGRCFVFEHGIVQGAYPPAAAALAADVAIHESLGAATAGIEAALAGVPTLLLDREGWPHSKLNGLGHGDVVFTAWDDLWEALGDYRRQPGTYCRLGDWSAMLDDFDPFRDGQAARRMGTFLKWLLDDLRSGVSRDIALADAADRYAAEWGCDNVVEMDNNPKGGI